MWSKTSEGEIYIHYMLCINKPFVNFGHFLTFSHFIRNLWEQKNEKSVRKNAVAMPL